MECPICLVNEVSTYIKVCNHKFCEKCIYQTMAYSNTCPMCRRVIDEMIRIYPLVINQDHKPDYKGFGNKKYKKKLKYKIIDFVYKYF